MKRILLLLGIFAFFSSLAIADEPDGDILDRADYNPDSPYYLNLHPSWSVGFRSVFLRNFPKNEGHPEIYSLFAEKILPFQTLGVFSAGIHLGSASFSFAQPFDGTQMFNIGADLRYQLYFMKNQLLVPTAVFIYDNFRYSGQASNSFGPMLGILLNLGFIDRASAREAATQTGLLRSYLSVEYRPQMKLSSSGQTFSSGDSIYVGVLLSLE